MRLSPNLPAGAHRRLVEHYGPSVRGRLDQVETIIATAAAQFGTTIDGFHDAGWTSIVAVAHRGDGQAVILKAFVDPNRYHQEQSALAHWNGRGACRLLDNDDTNLVLMTALVGGAPGGAPRPSDDTERVADALSRLHHVQVPPGTAVPTLRHYYLHTVLPRMQRRATRFGAAIGEPTIRRALEVGAELCEDSHPRSMLHSDLYTENVLFDVDGNPVFIDPHPKIGSPAFDWAFWCVYFRQDGQFDTRVGLCRRRVPELADEMLAWSLTLAVDGGLYYLDTNDPGWDEMRAVLASVEMTRIMASATPTTEL